IESGQTISNGATIDFTGATGGTTHVSSATVALSETINAVNDAPLITSIPVSYAATEQTTLDLAGSIGITDVDAGSGNVTTTLSVVSGTLTVTHGIVAATVTGSGTNSVTITGNVTAVYNVLQGSGGATDTYIIDSDDPPVTDTLTALVDDQGNTGSGGAKTATATATINITAVNDPPTGGADSYTVYENNSLTLAAPGVLGNDADPDGPPISVDEPRPVSGPANGSLTLTADGSFSYTPNTDWSGVDSFTYRATDGLADSALTTVTITVTDTAYASSGDWPVSFDASRYLAVSFPAYVPTGSTVGGASFTHTYRSETAGDTTCYYVEVYQGSTLVATHGSAGSPISCNGSTGWVTDVVSMPEINSVARANAVTIRLYVSNSGARRSLHRLMTVGITYHLD
ncbi:MAG: Ig-like domain-containing protein, partial [Acidimicrobiia bacterium]